MNPMSAEKVDKFLSFLNSEVVGQWEERSKLRGMGKSDLAYNCKNTKGSLTLRTMIQKKSGTWASCGKRVVMAKGSF
jgi:hypothetical protein